MMGNINLSGREWTWTWRMFILTDGNRYPVDDNNQIAAAQAAMRKDGTAEARVFSVDAAGEFRWNGMVLYAET